MNNGAQQEWPWTTPSSTSARRASEGNRKLSSKPLHSGIGQGDNWPATVGIFTGVFAKEAMVGSLDSLYGQLAAEASSEVAAADFDFWGGIAAAFASIPANLADLGNQLLDPIGLNKYLGDF